MMFASHGGQLLLTVGTQERMAGVAAVMVFLTISWAVALSFSYEGALDLGVSGHICSSLLPLSMESLDNQGHAFWCSCTESGAVGECWWRREKGI